MTMYIAAYDVEADECLDGVRRIVEVHTKYEMPATFFIVARLLDKQGDEYRRLIGDNPLFEIASHTYTHMLLREHRLVTLLLLGSLGGGGGFVDEVQRHGIRLQGNDLFLHRLRCLVLCYHGGRLYSGRNLRRSLQIRPGHVGLQQFAIDIGLKHLINVILENQKSKGCDFLIVGGYGYQPVIELLFGSTLDALLRQSDVPILICH